MSAPCRIAVVTTSYPADEGDGSGHFVRAEVRELERAGHEVAVVTPPMGGAFGWPGAAARVRERPWRALEAARWVAGARSRVARMQVDRVVAHWALPCAWPIALASPGAEVEVVSHGGDVRALVALPGAARGAIAAAIARRARRWRFVSEALAGQLCASLGSGARAAVERVAEVREPSLELPDVRDRVAALRRALAGERVAVSVGRLVASKRVERAIDHVAAARDLDALVVVGDGPERPRLEAHAQARGVDARFVGRVPRAEALAWIGAAARVVHASEKEGLSTVLREARAMGTRVVEI